MQRTRRHAWKMMGMAAVLALPVLGLSAWAGPPLSMASRETDGFQVPAKRRAPRSVLATGLAHTMVLGEGGSIWVWGDRDGAFLGAWPQIELGQGTPVRMPGMSGAVSVAIAGSSHSLALLEDGTVHAWGSNDLGQLGIGSTVSTKERVQVQGLTDVVSIAAGGRSSLALRADGTVWSWGANFDGQLGDGTTQRRTTPVQVAGLTEVIAVAGGGNYGLALRADGTLWGWGHSYKVGINMRFIAAPIPGVEAVEEFTADASYVLVLKRNGTVWGWGSNAHGTLGLGSQTDVEGLRPIPGMHGVVAVAASNVHSLALKRDGTVWGWGYNQSGALGTGSNRRSSPVTVRGLTDARVGASGNGHALAVSGDGSVWMWGSDGSPSSLLRPESAAPTPVPGLTGAVGAAGGWLHSLALRGDGSVWGWGVNWFGQLGDGGVGDGSTPVQAAGLVGVVAVAAGDYHSVALKQDGTVWSWGANFDGQLGDGTLEDRFTPVQVQGLEDIVFLAVRGDYSVTVRQDGTVWAWGTPTYYPGQVPLVPRQVVGLSSIRSVAVVETGQGYAIRADGTLWKWTDQGPGSPVPTRVEGIADVVSVAATPSSVHVVRVDGTVWSSGRNAFGLLGVPGPSSVQGWIQVPGLMGVVSLSANGSHVLAVLADGTAVSWGSNINGVIGDGLSPLHLSPTRVPLPCRLTAVSVSEGAPQRCEP